MNPRIVAFMNFKGGVGKTANVVNLGAAIAQLHQKRVLVVDLDAQCSSSLWLLSKAAWKQHASDARCTTFQIFQDHVMGTTRFDFDEAVVRGVPRNEEGFPLIESLDLLPASLKLLEVEERITPRGSDPYFKYLSHSLKPHLKAYDLVFLDCPPSFHAITKNALYLAGDIFIPYIPDFLSLSGFQMFAELLERFQDQVAGFKGGKLKGALAGVIVNRYQRAGNVYDEGITQLKMLIELLKEKGIAGPSTRVLEPSIRNCVRVAESPERHLPVTLHAPGSIGSQDYAELAQAVLKQLEVA